MTSKNLVGKAHAYRLDVIFFLFRLEADHEELNVHEKMFLLTLAVDQDENAEIDREMRRRGPEMLNLHMCVLIWRLGRWVSSDYNDSVFCKEETRTAIGMIQKKKKTNAQNC